MPRPRSRPLPKGVHERRHASGAGAIAAAARALDDLGEERAAELLAASVEALEPTRTARR